MCMFFILQLAQRGCEREMRGVQRLGYVEYLKLSLQLARPGTIILADNVIRNGLVLAENPPDSADRGARAYNDAIARHPRLESLVLPIVRRRVDGLAISIVK